MPGRGGRRLRQELNGRAEKAEPLEFLARDPGALGRDGQDEVLLETQRSEAFLATQRETLRASTDLRLAQRELAEYYSEMFGFPTRAELDDVHKTVTELRRELRALKRERPRRGPGATGSAQAPERQSARRRPRRPMLPAAAINPAEAIAEAAALGKRSPKARSCSARSRTRTSRSPRRRRTRSGARTR